MPSTMNLPSAALPAADGFGAVAAVRDQLGYQQIVEGRNHAICVSPRIHAHADTAGAGGN